MRSWPMPAYDGVPYIKESGFRGFGRLWSIMMGDSDMRRAHPLPAA